MCRGRPTQAAIDTAARPVIARKSINDGFATPTVFYRAARHQEVY